MLNLFLNFILLYFDWQELVYIALYVLKAVQKKENNYFFEFSYSRLFFPKGIPFLGMCSKIIESELYHDGIFTETKNLYLLFNSWMASYWWKIKIMYKKNQRKARILFISSRVSFPIQNFAKFYTKKIKPKFMPNPIFRTPIHLQS